MLYSKYHHTIPVFSSRLNHFSKSFFGAPRVLSFIFFLGVQFLFINRSQAQANTDKIVGAKNQAIVDSLKKVEYPYVFPIWGQKVIERGFKIPKSAGLSIQYIGQQSDIIIDNLQVGFNHGPMYSLDDIIRFNKSVASTNGVNIRPDFWLLPFLNVYAVFAQSKTSTEIDAGIWLPDNVGWKEVGKISTKANFNATTIGVGLTPTFGVGGFFLALDMNFSWSDISELEDPAYVFVLGPRFGKNIPLKKPDQTIAFWVGGFRVKMGTQTNGSINTGDLFPISQWQNTINQGYQNLDAKQTTVDNWWNGLTPAEQKKPANIAKHEAASSVLARFGGILDQASQVVNTAGNSSVQYSLEKRQKDMWNFIVGSQFQLNRSWMLRVEYGFLASRQQLIAGLQYRFNL